jgi:hypothetical protein
VTAAESKDLQKGTRVCWQGDAADRGIITQTSWDAVTITWDNGHVAIIPSALRHCRGFAPCQNRPRSDMIQRRPKRSATAPVVPLPQKRSATRFPSSEDAWMTRSKSFSGF